MVDKPDLIAWLKLQNLLKKTKEQEMTLRKAIASFIMGDKKAGTETRIFDDLEAKVSIQLSYSVDKGILLALHSLSDEEKECIAWEPKLKVKEYKALKKSKGDSPFPLMQAIIIKPSAPTLSMDMLEELP